jgi:hypothetical protein
VSVGSFALITRCPLCARLAGNFEHDHVALRDAKHAAGICAPMESSNGKREEVRRDPQLVFSRKSIDANVVRIRNSSFRVIEFVA